MMFHLRNEFDQDNKGDSTRDVAVTLWDTEVWSNPLSVFGKTTYVPTKVDSRKACTLIA